MRTIFRSVLRFLLIAIVALVAAHLLDGAAYRFLRDPRVYERDWGRMLRIMGFLPFWLVAALALALHDRGRAPADRSGRGAYARAIFLVLAPTLSGIAGGALQLVIRRERPWAHGGAYVFRPWSDHPLSTGGLSMPSSHAVVAFGAAFALARLFPRAAVVWYLLAAGCALTRVLAQAHFLSDVVLSALVAAAVVAGSWRWLGGRIGGALRSGWSQSPGAATSAVPREAPAPPPPPA